MQTKKYLYIFALLLFFGLKGFSQNTMYFMDRMPQKQAYNPALIPNVKFFMALPGLNGVSVNAYNSGFHYKELDDFIDQMDKVGYNPDEFVNSIGNTNRFMADAKANLLSFGFRLKDKGYFSFNYAVKSTLSIDAQSDIAYLLADYNDISVDKFPLIVEGIEVKGNSYTSIGFTYARKINSKLTIGISPNINYNVLGLRTEGLRYKVDIEETDPYGNVSFNETIEGNVYVGLPTGINAEAVNGDELDLDVDILPGGWEDDLNEGMFRNASFSVDIGATYQLNKWMFSSSILNLGSSKWKHNGYLLNGDQDVIKIREETVKMSIPTRLYLGVSRQFSPKWNYALLYNNNFYAGGTNSSATVSINGAVGRMLSASASYTAGYKYNNLGVGLRLRFLPGMDLYCVTDNIIQVFGYKSAYRLSAAVGINLSFGIKDGLPAKKGTDE